jgi:uncharacterized protein YcfJ
MTSNKILPVALVAALLGGTVGAFVMRPTKTTPDTTQAAKLNETATATDKTAVTDDQGNVLENELADATKGMSDAEKAAFRDGFMQGVEAARESDLTTNTTRTSASRVVYTPTRTVVRRNAPRRVYYNYGQTRGRSFWQKHRDKLTVAMGAGGGALLGGLIGGKKGAGIGALAGAGGSALYTYKIRKRNRNY